MYCSALCTKYTGQTCSNAAPVPCLLDAEEEIEESTPVFPETDDEDDD